MNRREIRARAGTYMMITRPRPYFVTLFYMLISQLVATVSLQVGGQPFVIDMEAAAAGDTENMLQFVPENVSLGASLLLLALELVLVLLDFGYASYCLHACRREKCSYFDLMDGFLVFFRAVGLQLLQGLIISLGTMLFIVPGVILSYVYAQSERLLLDHPDWSPVACMRESRRLMRGRLKEYFFLRLSLLLWNLACYFPIMEVFARPVVQFTETVYYLTLTGETLADLSQTGPGEKPPWEY